MPLLPFSLLGASIRAYPVLLCRVLTAQEVGFRGQGTEMTITEALRHGLLEECWGKLCHDNPGEQWYKGLGMTKLGRKTALKVARGHAERAVRRWDDDWLLELLLSSASAHRDTGSERAA